MRTLTVSLLLGLLLSVQAQHLDTGMVLLLTSPTRTPGERGKLEIIYLSTGRRIVLDDGATDKATFSPDGRKVALVVSGTIHTINIDGTGDVTLNAGTNGNIQWCADGYIYYKGLGNVARISEDNGTPQRFYVADERPSLVGPTGLSLGTYLGDWSLSLDGTIMTGTVSREGGGYANMCVDLVTDSQWSPAMPCQGAMAPSGRKMSISTGGGHHMYRMFDPRRPYQEFASGNTWEGCPPEHMCPTELDFISIRPYFWDSLGLDAAVRVNCINPKWSDSEEDIFHFCSDNTTGLPDSIGGSFIIQFPQKLFTRIGYQGTMIQGYYAEEIDLGNTPDYVLNPGTVSFSVDQAGALPAPKTVTLTSTPLMPSAPAVTGQPAWLLVEASLADAHTVTITNTLVQAALPGEGTVRDTVTVTPAGATGQLTYTVTLTVGPAPQGPIQIFSPVAGQTWYVGDTLRVRYSADSTQVIGTIVSLSTDGGDTYTMMHSGDAEPAGPDLTLEYVIPASLFGGSAAPGETLPDCVVKVSNYPNGFETYSGTFTIATAPTGTRCRAARPARAEALRAACRRDARGGASLAIHSPGPGIARLLDMRGRTVGSFVVHSGRQSVAVGPVPMGRFLLRVSYCNQADGAVWVQAF